MNNITREVFKPSDAYEIELRDYEASYLSREWIVDTAEDGSCATCFIDGKIVAIIGYVDEWPGVARVFVIPSRHLPKASLKFVRYIRRVLDRMIEDCGFHRMHTESKADENTDRWMTLIGFTCEGTLRKFSAAGEDYKVWARVS